MTEKPEGRGLRPIDGTKLYGLPGAEALHFDPVGLYESEIADYIDDPTSATSGVVIEEWSVHSPIYHVPAAGYILEYIVERIGEYGEVTEEVWDGWVTSLAQPEVTAEIIEAMDKVRELIASKFGKGRMANELLRTLTITWNDHGEPLLDGAPLYKPPLWAPPQVW